MEADPAFLRGLTQSRFSRRQFVRAGATAAAVAGFGSALSACGIAGTRDTGCAGRLRLGRVVERAAKARRRSTGPTGRSTSTPRTAATLARAFTKQTGSGQLQAGDPGQRLVLRPDQPGPPGRAGDRLRPDRDHRRLGADPDDQEQLADPARPLADARTSRATRRVDRADPDFDPRQRATRSPGSPGSPGSPTTRA